MSDRFWIITFVCMANCCFGQKQKKFKPFSELNFAPHFGVSWQSTPFKPVFDVSPIPEFDVTYFPYNYEKNTQGFGLDLGFTLTTNISRQIQTGVKVNGRFRYDYLYGGMESKPYTETVKGFLFDYSTSLILIYNTKKNKERDWIGEIGFTANQIGKDEFFDIRMNYQTYTYLFNYHYMSYNLGISYDLIKLSDKFYINTGITYNYIPKDFPMYRFRDFGTLGFKAIIRFKPGKAVFIK